MRAATAGAFALGCATGVALLAGVLWWNGAIGTGAGAGAASDGADNLPPVQLPSPGLPDLSAAGRQPEPAPLVIPPVEPPVQGQADRSAPELPAQSEPPRLGMPISGMDPKTLTSTFNEARGERKHEALDIPAPRGTPVMAVAEGNVVKLFSSKDGGLTVYQLDNTRTWSFYYAHLDRYAPGLKEGTLLRKGDVLGYVGTTGNAPKNTPHLHFAVSRLGPEKEWWKGTPIDPLPLLR
jgi:murein DD-endopeptidase MepM/ murein hydrolase activator NlpD